MLFGAGQSIWSTQKPTPVGRFSPPSSPMMLSPNAPVFSPESQPDPAGCLLPAILALPSPVRIELAAEEPSFQAASRSLQQAIRKVLQPRDNVERSVDVPMVGVRTVLNLHCRAYLNVRYVFGDVAVSIHLDSTKFFYWNPQDNPNVSRSNNVVKLFRQTVWECRGVDLDAKFPSPEHWYAESQHIMRHVANVMSHLNVDKLGLTPLRLGKPEHADPAWTFLKPVVSFSNCCGCGARTALYTPCCRIPLCFVCRDGMESSMKKEKLTFPCVCGKDLRFLQEDVVTLVDV